LARWSIGECAATISYVRKIATFASVIKIVCTLPAKVVDGEVQRVTTGTVTGEEEDWRR